MEGNRILAGAAFGLALVGGAVAHNMGAEVFAGGRPEVLASAETGMHLEVLRMQDITVGECEKGAVGDMTRNATAGSDLATPDRVAHGLDWSCSSGDRAAHVDTGKLLANEFPQLYQAGEHVNQAKDATEYDLWEQAGSFAVGAVAGALLPYGAQAAGRKLRAHVQGRREQLLDSEATVLFDAEDTADADVADMLPSADTDPDKTQELHRVELGAPA